MNITTIQRANPIVSIKDLYGKSNIILTYNCLLLPPKLYLVVFYQAILVNQTRITCSDFRRPSVLFLENFVVLYHMFIPPWGNCNKCSSMVVSVKGSVSWTFFVNLISPKCFFPWLLLVVE